MRSTRASGAASETGSHTLTSPTLGRGEHARHHIGAHMTGTRNKQLGRIRPSQPLGAKRSGGTGTKSSDSGGIKQRQRLARRVVAQQRGAKDLGQPLFGILREPSSELEAEEAASRQLARAGYPYRPRRVRTAHIPSATQHPCPLPSGDMPPPRQRLHPRSSAPWKLPRPKAPPSAPSSILSAKALRCFTVRFSNDAAKDHFLLESTTILNLIFRSISRYLNYFSHQRHIDV